MDVLSRRSHSNGLTRARHTRGDGAGKAEVAFLRSALANGM